MSDIDTTILKDALPKASWKCPHCGATNIVGQDAASLLADYGKYLEHCGSCNYLHFWRLELTDDFKREAINSLLNRRT